MSAGETKAGSRPGRRGPIHPALTVRQLAMDYPGCVEVFRRHGEEDRPGVKFGRLEPLTHFARRRGIPLDALLTELSQASGVEIARDDPAGRPAHRPFIALALAVTLTLGAGWGALLLFQIGVHGAWTTVPSAQVVAHGESQLWGFIVPFIIGVAVGFLPKTTARPRPNPALLALLWGLILAGVVGGFAWALDARRWPWLGPTSGLIQLAIALLYFKVAFGQVSGKIQNTWARFVLAAAFWMIVWAATDLWNRIGGGAAGPGDYADTSLRIAVEFAIFGFAMNSVFGFGLRLLPGILGGGSPRAGAVDATLILHNLGVLFLTASHALWSSVFAPLGATLILAGGASWAVGLKGFHSERRSAPRPEAGPAFLARYVQLAFFWFLVGVAMLAGGEIVAAIRGVELPRAYVGATRHALTVGFLTTLILGVGQRLLPILSHDLLAWPGLVAPTFVLIALGNALRVVGELATLAWPVVFRILPFSAVLELTALALFTANVLRTLWPRRDPLLKTGRATRMTRVAVMMAEHPWLETHLVAAGIGYLGRVRAIPSELTVHSLCVGERADPDAVVARINELLAERASTTPTPGDRPASEPG